MTVIGLWRGSGSTIVTDKEQGVSVPQGRDNNEAGSGTMTGMQGANNMFLFASSVKMLEPSHLQVLSQPQRHQFCVRFRLASHFTLPRCLPSSTFCILPVTPDPYLTNLLTDSSLPSCPWLLSVHKAL